MTIEAIFGDFPRLAGKYSYGRVTPIRVMPRDSSETANLPFRKVFKDRFRSPSVVSLIRQLAPFTSLPGSRLASALSQPCE